MMEIMLRVQRKIRRKRRMVVVEWRVCLLLFVFLFYPIAKILQLYLGNDMMYEISKRKPDSRDF